MWFILNKLREKTDAQKVVISFVSAIVITFVIVVTWFTLSFSSKEEEEKGVEVKEQTEEVTPISNIGSQISEIKSMFGELFSEIKSSEEEIKEIPTMIEEIENQANIDMASSTASTTVSTTISTTTSTTTLKIESTNE
jgi:Tfp pilus assembly protein PilO